MPVGILAFNGLAPFVSDLKKLCTEFPKTQLLLDHLGFFRQPAIGGQASATNDEATWRHGRQRVAGSVVSFCNC